MSEDKNKNYCVVRKVRQNKWVPGGLHRKQAAFLPQTSNFRDMETFNKSPPPFP